MIEIPGYRVVKPIGRGGMATVYLALQESVQREIALKIMSPTLSGEPEFGERFLREARIAAKLRHPHVVAVHDVGREGDIHFIAMELLPGGPVRRRGDAASDVDHALRVTRDIAAALDYAHERGVVHRDIKPDNILQREDGAAVLTDFGIARASDSLRMTRTGAIVGTPQYMSPEQARGKPIDGRADLYSLGVVLHELLTGVVPFRADDPVATGILHMTAPRPRLPSALAHCQGLLDRLLAVAPERRFQRGADVVAEIERLLGVVSPSPLRSSPPLASHDTVFSPPPPGMGRREPRLHDWGALDLRAEVRPRAARRRRWPWLLSAGLMAALAVLAWREQERLRDWLPQTRMARLEGVADAALAAGRLDGDDGALPAFRAMLAMDPENARARQGLREIGEYALREASAAIEAGDLERAAARLGLARELGVPDALLAPLQARLAPPPRPDTLEPLLLQARAALAAGHLSGGADSAAALFRRVLEQDPAHALARRGLADTQQGLLAIAQDRIAEDDLEAAQQRIADVEALDPAHPGLPQARAALGEAQAGRRARREVALAEAEASLAAGRLVEGEDSARARYRRLLEAEPGLEAAREGLQRVAGKLLEQAQRRAADFEFDAARALIAEAERTAADHPGLAASRLRLAEAEAAQRRLNAGAGADAATSGTRLAALLADAADAVDAGRLVSPPGSSAYDLYRAAQAIAPAHAEVRDGLARLPGLARSAVETALGQRALSRASGYLDALQTLDAGDPALPDLRRRVASAYLALAIERLEGGQLRGADEAVERAREIDPNHPELAAVRARVEQAGG